MVEIPSEARPPWSAGVTAGRAPGSEDEALGIVEAGEAIGIPTVTLLLQGMAMTLAQPRGAVWLARASIRTQTVTRTEANAVATPT